MWRCATSTSRAPIPICAPGLQTPGATHLIKVAVEAALGRRERIDVYGTDYDDAGRHLHPRLHPCQRSGARASRGAGYLRAGNESATLNCGYGRGYSIREVLDAVERNHGRKFPVNFSDRRPGDIVVSVAAASRIRQTLDWIPEFERPRHHRAPRARLGAQADGRSDAGARGGGFGVSDISAVIPGRAVRREPGIHNHCCGVWISGSRTSFAPRNDSSGIFGNFQVNSMF